MEEKGGDRWAFRSEARIPPPLLPSTRADLLPPPEKTPLSCGRLSPRQIKISNQRIRPPRKTGARDGVGAAQTWRECAGKNHELAHAHSQLLLSLCGPRRRDQHLTPSVRPTHIARLPSGLTVHPSPSSPERRGSASVQGGPRVSPTI